MSSSHRNARSVQYGRDLLATWIAKEQLRDLLGCAALSADRHLVRARLFDFYTWCATTDVPEVHTLAELIENWWPAVLTFLPHRRG